MIALEFLALFLLWLGVLLWTDYLVLWNSLTSIPNRRVLFMPSFSTNIFSLLAAKIAISSVILILFLPLVILSELVVPHQQATQPATWTTTWIVLVCGCIVLIHFLGFYFPFKKLKKWIYSDIEFSAPEEHSVLAGKITKKAIIDTGISLFFASLVYGLIACTIYSRD